MYGPILIMQRNEVDNFHTQKEFFMMFNVTVNFECNSTQKLREIICCIFFGTFSCINEVMLMISLIVSMSVDWSQ